MCLLFYVSNSEFVLEKYPLISSARVRVILPSKKKKKTVLSRTAISNFVEYFNNCFFFFFLRKRTREVCCKCDQKSRITIKGEEQQHRFTNQPRSLKRVNFHFTLSQREREREAEVYLTDVSHAFLCNPVPLRSTGNRLIPVRREIEKERFLVRLVRVIHCELKKSRTRFSSVSIYREQNTDKRNKV